MRSRGLLLEVLLAAAVALGSARIANAQDVAPQPQNVAPAPHDVAPPPAVAPRLLNDQQPALNDGGPRPAPAPAVPRPMAYAIMFGLLVFGAGIGLVALLTIRRWDRSRPIEREAESVVVQQGPTYEKRLAPQQRV